MIIIRNIISALAPAVAGNHLHIASSNRRPPSGGPIWRHMVEHKHRQESSIAPLRAPPVYLSTETPE